MSFLSKIQAHYAIKADAGSNCVVCGKPVPSQELQEVAKEFKPYPAHTDCFDSFDNADDFIKFAKHKLKK